MTAIALASETQLTALACQDDCDFAVASTPVRTFADNRLHFVLANAVEALRSSHVVYDHAATARAHTPRLLPQRPYAVWLHGWELWTSPPAKYLRAFERAALIIANSAYTVERAGKALPPGADVRICPLATYAEKEGEAPTQHDGSPTVLLVGRVDELFAKGHDILIDVWPRVSATIPNAKLVFVGGGPALNRLRRLVALSPARHAIEVAGFVPEEAMEAYWQRASVFAMLGFGEGFGLVYADAMRHSLPVIASTDDAGQEVNIDGVTGYNVSRRDPKRLTEVLVELLRNSNSAQTLGQGGLARWRENYTFTAFRSRFLRATADFLST